MTARVKEILSWYGSDNPGVKANLARLMNTGRLAGTGKFVILPVDQGFEHGPARSFAPNPSGYDPRYHVELSIEAGCNWPVLIGWAIRLFVTRATTTSTDPSPGVISLTPRR